MTPYINSLTLDVNAENSHLFVDAKQLDSKSRHLNVLIVANGVPIDFETGTTAMFRAVKPDGHSVCYEAQINENGTIDVEISQQTLACKGVVKADLSLVGENGSVLSTASFYVQVHEAPIGDNSASRNEMLAFQQLTEEAAMFSAQSEAYASEAGMRSVEASEAAALAQSAKTSAEAAADLANTAASLVADEIDSTLVKDTTNNTEYLAKLRIINGKPVVQVAEM